MRPRRMPRTPRGQALVEFAVVLPLFLLCLIGALDAGLWAVQTSAEVSAVEQAAMIASSAGSSPASETAPDARAVTAAISGRLRSALFGTTDRELVRDRRERRLRAGLPRSSARRRPAEVQDADGPRVVVVCVSEADPPACTTPPPGQAAPYPPGCDDSPMITVRVIGFVASFVPPGFGPGGDRIRAPDKHLGNDSHAPLRSVTRSGRRGDDAQAVLETALVIPILLFLVCNFIAVMVQVTVQEQLNSATALAAQSRFQAPENAVDPAGTRCCGAQGLALVTAGLPTGCRYAAETFYGTMTTYTGLLHWQTAALCTSGGDSGNAAIRRCNRWHTPGSPSERGRVVRHRLDQVRRHVVPGYVDRTLQSARRSRRRHVQRVGVARLREHAAGLGRVLDADAARAGRGAPASVPSVTLRRIRVRAGRAPAWPDTDHVRARFRAVPVQPHVPGR